MNIMAELNRIGNQINFAYLHNTNDFAEAQAHGFEAYPAFQDVNKVHDDVLDAFMRRLPPRTRGDFTQYLEGLRLQHNAQMSDFALLGYSGAKLLSDDFSIIHPFSHVENACELLLEAAGYRHIQGDDKTKIQIDDSATFTKEFNAATQEIAVCIDVNNTHIGYVNRSLIPTFLDWICKNRIEGAWVEKINGTPGKPAVYLYVKIRPENYK